MGNALITGLAIIIGIIGVAAIFLGLFTWNLIGFLLGCFALLTAYAWSEVNDLWRRVEDLESKHHA